MPLDEKPLLPLSGSPPCSRSSSPPPASPALKLLATSTGVRGGILCGGGRRRWIAFLLLYLVVFAVGWYRDVCAHVWRTARWRAAGGALQGGGKVIYDAYGEPFVLPPPDRLANDTAYVSSHATTSLGLEADKVYHLGSSLFTSNPAVYLSTLEDFLRHHFPPSDSDEDDPNSLINALRAYFPDPPAHSPSPSSPSTADERIHYPPIPHRIWQTAPSEEYYAMKGGVVRSWREQNSAEEGWELEFHDNARADAWVRDRFDLEPKPKAEGRGKRQAGPVETASPGSTNSTSTASPTASRGVVAAWDRLSTPAVLRSDFWRYLVLAVEGGVYADTDVECMKPVERWGMDLSWDGQAPEDYEPPSLIVGIEADVGNRKDWHQFWPRPLQVSQWTMASARGHPVLLDVVRRVVELALEPRNANAKSLSVMEQTGPGQFTDAVLAYLLVKFRTPWASLRGLEDDGWRFHGDENEAGGWGDIKVLQITGFSPGIGHQGAHNKESPVAMASHQFAGSWRTQQGADA
ncbi:hypothetical protein JCM5296_004871 [Sporobolomyces johnsonii]